MSKKLVIGFLLMIGMIIGGAMALAASQENVTTSLSLYVAPTISNVLVDDADQSVANQIDLTPATTTQVWCSGIITIKMEKTI